MPDGSRRPAVCMAYHLIDASDQPREELFVNHFCQGVTGVDTRLGRLRHLDRLRVWPISRKSAAAAAAARRYTTPTALEHKKHACRMGRRAVASFTCVSPVTLTREHVMPLVSTS